MIWKCTKTVSTSAFLLFLAGCVPDVTRKSGADDGVAGMVAGDGGTGMGGGGGAGMGGGASTTAGQTGIRTASAGSPAVGGSNGSGCAGKDGHAGETGSAAVGGALGVSGERGTAGAPITTGGTSASSGADVSTSGGVVATGGTIAGGAPIFAGMAGSAGLGQVGGETGGSAGSAGTSSTAAGQAGLAPDGARCVTGIACASGLCQGEYCQSLRLLSRWYGAGNTEADDVWASLVYRFGSLSLLPNGWTHVQEFTLDAQQATVEAGTSLPLDRSPVCSTQGTVSSETFTDLGKQGKWVFQRINGGDSNRPKFAVNYTDPTGGLRVYSDVAFVQFYVQYPGTATDYKVVWVIYPNGAIRLNHLRRDPGADTSQQFSSSHWLGLRDSLPDQVDSSGCLQSRSEIRIQSISIRHGANGTPLVTMSGVNQNSGISVFDISWTLSIENPEIGMTRVRVVQTSTATVDVPLAKLEGVSVLFGPQMSSMYKDSTSFDSNWVTSATGPSALGVGTLAKSPTGFNPTLPWNVGHVVRLDKNAATTHNVLGPAISLTPM
jgi:hypothetical protein